MGVSTVCKIMFISVFRPESTIFILAAVLQACQVYKLLHGNRTSDMMLTALSAEPLHNVHITKSNTVGVGGGGRKGR